MRQNLTTVPLIWLRANGPVEAGSASLRIAESMEVLLQPGATFEDSRFNPEGRLVTWQARGGVFPENSHAAAISFMITETTWQAAWSNPVWDSMEYNVSTGS